MRGFMSVIVLGLGLAVAPAALAQDDTDTGRGFGMMGGACPTFGMMGRGMMGGGMMGGGRMFRDHEPMMGGRRFGAVIDGRLAFLKSELEITDAQKAAWDGYAEAVQARIAAMKSMHESMADRMGKGSALERMDARIAGMETMLGALKAVRPAIETLYATLDDSQKARADELIGAGCGAM